jgi:hypothetical protein
VRDVARRAVVQGQAGPALDERATTQTALGVDDETGQIRRATADDRGHLDRVRTLETAEGDRQARAQNELADGSGEELFVGVGGCRRHMRLPTSGGDVCVTRLRIVVDTTASTDARTVTMRQGGHMSTSEPAPPGGIDYVAVEESAPFTELKRRHRSFVLPLSIAFLAWYFAYVLLSSFAGEFMATPCGATSTSGSCWGSVSS